MISSGLDSFMIQSRAGRDSNDGGSAMISVFRDVLFQDFRLFDYPNSNGAELPAPGCTFAAFPVLGKPFQFGDGRL